MSISELYKVTEVELIYRNKVKAKDRPKVTTSLHAYEILKHAWDMDKIDLQEEFKILLLNRGGHCLGISHVASGGVSACLVDTKLIALPAIKANAASIILAHNHPSGNLKPSKEDEQLTRKLCEAARLFEVNILDHIIMSSEGYTSLADEGNAALVSWSGHSFTR